MPVTPVTSNPHVSRYAPGATLAPHQHDRSWLCLVVAGCYLERIRSREQDHEVGDLLFCPAFTTHSQRIGPAGSTKILWSPSTDSLDYLRDQGVALADAPCLRRSPDLVSLGARLWRELSIDDAFAPLAAHGLALELLAGFGRRLGDNARQPARWLVRLKQRLDDCASAGVSLNDLAAEAGRHPVHVARTFREFFGCTIGEYARRIRAEMAAGLLRSTKRPLIDIAMECGYGSASQFSRSFKAAFGVLPSAYRTLSR